MNLNNRILVFSYDAGGANLTMAYAYFKSLLGYEVLCFPKGPAIEIFKNHIPNLISNKSINFNNNDIIVTGTSGIHSDYEMEIIKKNRNIVSKTICLLDAPGNLELRFSINNILLEDKYLPDEIHYEKKINLSTYPQINKRLLIKENLYLKYLKDVYYKKEQCPKNKEILKYKNKYLLILTEYISELYGNKFGFDEYDFLEDILCEIDNNSEEIVVFIKLHPAEKKDKYDSIINRFNRIKIFKDDYKIQEILYFSKLVFGLNSSVFKEAIVLEKPIYSIQIGAKKPLDTLVDVPVINNKRELKNIINKYYKEEI